MLQAKGLLDALNKLEKNDDTDLRKQNNDYDLGEVLRFFGADENKTQERKLRYSDRTEECFLFDDN